MKRSRKFPYTGTGADGCLDIGLLFGNTRPVEVDLGCGKGLFLTREAVARPEVNFLGVDRLSRKLDRTLRRLRARGAENVRLLRCDALYFVEKILPPESISVFHVYFPDPWPKKRHMKHRFLTQDMNCALLRALEPQGRLWLITDDEGYFESIVDLFQDTPAFERTKFYVPGTYSVTDFEEEFLENSLPLYRIGFVKNTQK